MAIDKDMKRLQRMLDKKESKDSDIRRGWGSDKADSMSRIAFCLRYGQRFSALVESLEKSMEKIRSHEYLKENRNDLNNHSNTERDTSQDMSISF